GILNNAQISLAGTSSGSASFPPNIDFYLMLDNSPSMAIAATSAGIQTMLANTTAQDSGAGCAFACHETAPQLENGGAGLGNKNAQGKVDKTVDNYALAARLGVATRIQLVGNAVTSLATTATKTAQGNQSTYRMAVYKFSTYPNNQTAQQMQVYALTSNLSTISSMPAGTIDVLPVYTNNYITSGVNNNDMDTDFDSAMSAMNTLMPN